MENETLTALLTLQNISKYEKYYFCFNSMCYVVSLHNQNNTLNKFV